MGGWDTDTEWSDHDRIFKTQAANIAHFSVRGYVDQVGLAKRPILIESKPKQLLPPLVLERPRRQHAVRRPDEFGKVGVGSGSGRVDLFSDFAETRIPESMNMYYVIIRNLDLIEANELHTRIEFVAIFVIGISDGYRNLVPLRSELVRHFSREDARPCCLPHPCYGMENLHVILSYL